jgi:hypothetical protein
MQFNREWTRMNANKDSEPVNPNAIVCSSDWRGAMNFQWRAGRFPGETILPHRHEFVTFL